MPRGVVIALISIVALLIVYFSGPSPATPKWDTKFPEVPEDPAALEQFILANESRHRVKPDNEARIIWFDSTRRKTPFSVIYLHGFSASRKEGDPVHTDFAKLFGCNLYLPRLADHGIDTTEELLYFTSDRFWESSKEALAIGSAIGEKVIVMGCSSGGTMGLMLAATYPDRVFSLMNFSPNIEINDPSAWILNNPWGLQIARLVLGGKYNNIRFDSVKRLQYWNTKYRIEATTELQEMLEDKMHEETFRRVRCPVLTLYYYKNEQEQDQTVRVSAMLRMQSLLSSPDSAKVAQAIPNAGAHVIASHLASHDLPAVEKAITDFATGKLGMTPIQPTF